MTKITAILSGSVAAAILMVAPATNAVTFTGTDSFGRSASATFSLSSGTLTITLANISSADVLAPNQVLTALFFDTNPNTALTPVSATVAAGSHTVYGPDVPNVGGEWSYAQNLTGPGIGTAEQGTSSTGLGLFSPSGNFPGPNLQGPVSVDGLQYGLTSAGDDITTGNSAVTGGFALTKNAVVLTLTAVPADFTISNVRFLYGTSLDGPILVAGSSSPDPTPDVPDGGSTLTMLGSALLGAGILRRRFAKA